MRLGSLRCKLWQNLAFALILIALAVVATGPVLGYDPPIPSAEDRERLDVVDEAVAAHADGRVERGPEIGIGAQPVSFPGALARQAPCVANEVCRAIAVARR